MTDITLVELQAIAFDIKTPDSYSQYLINALIRAEKCCAKLNEKLQNVQFTIDTNGSIMPLAKDLA